MAVATLLPNHSSSSRSETAKASSDCVCEIQREAVLIKHNRCMEGLASEGEYLHILIIHYSLYHIITWQNQYRRSHRKQRKQH